VFRGVRGAGSIHGLLSLNYEFFTAAFLLVLVVGLRFSLVGFFFVAGFSGSLFSRSLMLFMASTLGGSPDIAFFSVAIVCAVVIKMI
jgi:hypothetical protein